MTAPLYDPSWAGRLDETFAVGVYEKATRVDNVPGHYPPDDTGSSGLAVAKVLKQAGMIRAYHHTFSFAHFLEALTLGPVMVGVSWYRAMFTPTIDGELVAADPLNEGHEVVCDEIDTARARVWITNSWGPDWGLQGRAWWSFATIENLLAGQGDATVLVR